MYFVNMLSNGEYQRKGNPFKVEVESPMRGGVCYDKAKKILSVSSNQENLFTLPTIGDYEEYNPTKNKRIKNHVPILFKDVKDTEENPLITVLCSVVRVYEGIPTGLKFLYLNDSSVLVCLLYGVADFDGVQMQRAVTVDTSNKSSKVLKGSDFKNLVDSTSDEMDGYSYLSEGVFQVELNYKNTSSGESFSSRLAKSEVNIFDTTGIEKAKERKKLHDQKVKEMEEQKAREAEERRIEKERRKQKLIEQIDEEIARSKSKPQKESERVENSVYSKNAAAFLRIVTGRG